MGTKLRRKNAQAMNEIICDLLKSMRLNYGMTSHLVFGAWDRVSGAGPYTAKRFFRDGKLYITLNSSVVRSQLRMQQSFLLEKINAELASDPVFAPLGRLDSADGSDTGKNEYVRELILK